jgi:hypothetical protein
MVTTAASTSSVLERPANAAIAMQPSGGDGPIDPYDVPPAPYGYPEDPYAYHYAVGDAPHA